MWNDHRAGRVEPRAGGQAAEERTHGTVAAGRARAADSSANAATRPRSSAQQPAAVARGADGAADGRSGQIPALWKPSHLRLACELGTTFQ